MNARLMWELVDKPKLAFRLVMFVFLTLGISTGTRMQYLYLVVMGLIALMGPAGDAFWILGLSRRDYNLQRRIEVGASVTIFVVVILLITQMPWFLIAGYLAIAAVVLFWDLRSEEHTSELQSRGHLVCRLLLEKKKRMLYRLYV